MCFARIFACNKAQPNEEKTIESQPILKVYDIDFDGTSAHIMDWILRHPELVNSVLHHKTKEDQLNFEINKKTIKYELLQFLVIRLIAHDLKQPNTIVRLSNFSNRQDAFWDLESRIQLFDFYKNDSGSNFYFLEYLEKLLQIVFECKEINGVKQLELDTFCMSQFFDKQLAAEDLFAQGLKPEFQAIYQNKEELRSVQSTVKNHNIIYADPDKIMIVFGHAHRFAKLYPGYKLFYRAIDDIDSNVEGLKQYFKEESAILPEMQGQFIHYEEACDKNPTLLKSHTWSFVGTGYDKNYLDLLESMQQQVATNDKLEFPSSAAKMAFI